MSELELLLNNFANAVVNIQRNKEFNELQLLKYYPNGCCDICCDLLSQYLLDHNIITQIIIGKDNDNNRHVWLKYNNIFIDITLRQFVFDCPVVYIGEPHKIHRKYLHDFECELPGIYNKYNNFVFEQKVMNTYKTILEYIN